MIFERDDLQQAPVCVSELTCVEDAGGQRRRKALVQQEFAENHPCRLPGEPPLQGAQPEVVEVSMETDCHDGHVARVLPVDALLLSDELMGKVAAGEQAPVQSDVGQPGEAFGGFFQHSSPHRGTGEGAGPRWRVCVLGGPERLGLSSHSASIAGFYHWGLESVSWPPIHLRVVIGKGLNVSTCSGNIRFQRPNLKYSLRQNFPQTLQSAYWRSA